MIKITNASVDAQTYAGVEIQANEYYEVPTLDEDKFRRDAKLRYHIKNSMASAGDGYEDSFGPDGIEILDRDARTSVTTALEEPSTDLLLASDDQPFVDGVCKLSILVPGDLGVLGARKIAGGYGFTDVFGWGDRVSRVQLLDKDYAYAGILYPSEPAPGVTWAEAMPDGVEMGSYTDDDLPEANRGWRIWAEGPPGSQGGVDIDPLGGLGKLLALCYLVVTIEKAATSTATRAALNAWWGRPST